MASSTTKNSIFDCLNKKSFFPTRPLKETLPISQSGPQESLNQGLRRRLSSFSVRIQPISSSSPASWAFRRSKSMPSIGEAGTSLRKWWDWSWGWVLSRKPNFARDLEMNEEESAMLGSHGKGSWRHVFHKVRSEIKRLVGLSPVPSTQGFRYDSFSYAQNFDDGKRSEG